jgi:predicted AAA+ superfamily ATPase
MIQRTLYPIIRSRFHQGKAILLIGPRQVGKTTLIHQLLSDVDHLFINGDDPATIALLDHPDSQRIRDVIGQAKMVFIDEAQRIPGLGITLKIITDQMKDVQVIASGSSALDLRSMTEEPLTGRKWTYHLFPISWQEWQNHLGFIKSEQDLESRLVHGLYPDVLNRPDDRDQTLLELVNSYLFKDVFALGQVNKPQAIEQLLKTLAYQVGSEVSYHELAQLLRIDLKTVVAYIDLLEQAYVVFRLGAFSRNLRNEIATCRKIYFYDNGVRNAVIGDLRPLPLRQDAGPLWENFLMSERKKMLAYAGSTAQSFFWRTRQQQEVDYVEVLHDLVSGFEFKWNPMQRTRFPKTFIDAYQPVTKVVTRENFREFLLP